MLSFKEFRKPSEKIYKLTPYFVVFVHSLLVSGVRKEEPESSQLISTNPTRFIFGNLKKLSLKKKILLKVREVTKEFASVVPKVTVFEGILSINGRNPNTSG